MREISRIMLLFSVIFQKCLQRSTFIAYCVILHNNLYSIYNIISAKYSADFVIVLIRTSKRSTITKSALYLVEMIFCTCDEFSAEKFSGSCFRRGCLDSSQLNTQKVGHTQNSGRRAPKLGEPCDRL